MEFFSCPETGTYLCYAYGRLSKKDAEKARRENDESNSIKNQRDLIHEYIDRHPDLTLCMEGYDDNYTGTNFDRPHFQEMIQAVEVGYLANHWEELHLTNAGWVDREMAGPMSSVMGRMSTSAGAVFSLLFR